MYFYCAFDEAFLRDQIACSDESKILVRAYEEFEKGDSVQGHRIIAELVSRNHPLALVLSSMFSEGGETERRFRVRHLAQLKVSAASGNSLALYSLGVYCDTGEFLERDQKLAFEYFKQAAERDMPQAMHIYGVMLYYGTGGADKDPGRGLALIRSAALSEVSEAREFLEYLSRSAGDDHHRVP